MVGELQSCRHLLRDAPLMRRRRLSGCSQDADASRDGASVWHLTGRGLLVPTATETPASFVRTAALPISHARPLFCWPTT
jgi:hypothetical protein